jgi:hypothetical protein
MKKLQGPYISLIDIAILSVTKAKSRQVTFVYQSTTDEQQCTMSVAKFVVEYVD